MKVGRGCLGGMRVGRESVGDMRVSGSMGEYDGREEVCGKA